MTEAEPITMPTPILMPALSPDQQEGKLARWLVRAGDRVRAGDVIAEIEADRSTMEIEATDDGTLVEILVPAGTLNVRASTPIALLNGVAVRVDGTGPETAGADADPVETGAAVPLAVGDEPASDGAFDHITLREALRDAMAEEMRRDAGVFLIGEQVGEGGGAHKAGQGLIEEFGAGRVLDTPIATQGFAGLAIGAAMAGLRPVVEFMSWSFASQAVDQIVNSAAKTRYRSGGEMSVPVVFRGPDGASSRAAAQHSQCFAAWYAHVPGLKVVAPSTPADAKGLLKAAIRDPDPVLVLESEALYAATGPVPRGEDVLVEIGRARIARPGRDVTIVGYGRAVTTALAAAELLAAEGIDAEVIDLRTLRPLDMATVVYSVERTNRIVTVEEAWPVCSIGSEVCARVAIEAFDHLDAPPAKVAGADVPMPYAANLERLALPDAAAVTAAVKAVLDV